MHYAKCLSSQLLSLIGIFCLGCNERASYQNDVPEDFESFAVQAAICITKISETTKLESAIVKLLEQKGCSYNGHATLYDGTYAGSMYVDEPYLCVSVYPERDRKIDLRLYYHRKKPEQLEDWIDRFCASMDKTEGIRYQVYEKASTGPF